MLDMLVTNVPVIVTGSWSDFSRRSIAGQAGTLSVRCGGPEHGSAVLFAHSILTSSAVWRRQAALLAGRGYRILCPDMRGHGKSAATPAPYSMDDLVEDAVMILDGFGIDRAHVIGVSQGGMIGFGLGVRHAERLASLCIIAARADAPPSFAAAWDDRIALVEAQGSVDLLVNPTVERWFGARFLDSHPGVVADLQVCIRETSPQGFVGCARAIQGFDYLRGIPDIATPTALLIGEGDTLLLQPMKDLLPRMRNAVLHVIDGAGHLPQVDRPEAFDAHLLRHFERVGTTRSRVASL
jgi:3-oxoadipate enol-lactonase